MFFIVMNSASFLLCFVFAGIGYVMYPMILPKLVDADLVSASSMSASSDKDVVDDKDSSASEGDEGSVEEPSKPEVVGAPITPAVVKIPAEEPKPVMPEAVEMVQPVVEPATPAPIVSEKVVDAPVMEDKLTDAQFIKALKSSVKAGDVNEFSFAAVEDWKRMDEQSIDGGVYEVGMVTYTASTIFGDQQLQAKALVKGGKVVKWLWPETNTEMR